MFHSVGLLRPVGSLIGFLRVLLLDMGGRQLHLDDVRADQRGDVRSISADIQRKLALLRQIAARSEEHTSELQSLMRISYAVFCLKKKKIRVLPHHNTILKINKKNILHTIK